MFKKTASFTLLLLCIIPFIASAAFRLPDTGQTRCYQSVSPYGEIPCAGTGQDGSYNINPLFYTNNGDGTVTDKNTGLMWQMVDDNQEYNWYQASGSTNATYNASSQNVCAELQLGGWADWRLPSKKELITIISYSSPHGPLIYSKYFPNTKTYTYWSSTSYPFFPDSVYTGNFFYGAVYADYKDSDAYVRCVRGGEQTRSLNDNHNGTVTDSRTGLTWQQGESIAMTWASALSYCEGLYLGGNSDWRLPNIKELESLSDDTRFNPAIDTAFFPSASASNYWSSTTYASSPDSAWYMNFAYGYSNFYPKGSLIYARCVRGGDLGPLPGFFISNDFDGDRKADITVWRPEDGNWFTINSADSTQSVANYGTAGDVPVPGDYDGDGQGDKAVWRNGTWFIQNSSTGTQSVLNYGASGDTPVPGDYDGIGKTEIAVFRPSSGTWFIMNPAANTQRVVNYGTDGDTPVPGDYDGDGKTDIAVFRPSTGTWFIRNSATGTQSVLNCGANGDVPVPGDYDGIGKSEIAIFQPSSGIWLIMNTADSTQHALDFGTSGDIPVPGDYDGDGKTDIAVFRPSAGTWFILQSLTGTTRVIPWGTSTDVPIK